MEGKYKKESCLESHSSLTKDIEDQCKSFEQWE
jgi:hypothetical protein